MDTLFSKAELLRPVCQEVIPTPSCCQIAITFFDPPAHVFFLAYYRIRHSSHVSAPHEVFGSSLSEARRPQAGQRGSWPQAPHSCRKQSRPGWPGHGRIQGDITRILVSSFKRSRKRKLTRSMASRSSSVTEMAWAPGGRGTSSSASSPRSCRNWSGFEAMSWASCGLPAPSC